MYVLLYVSYLYICNVIGANKNKFKKKKNIFEKISLNLILLMIFDIYFFCYLATNEKIAITHFLGEMVTMNDHGLHGIPYSYEGPDHQKPWT